MSTRRRQLAHIAEMGESCVCVVWCVWGGVAGQGGECPGCCGGDGPCGSDVRSEQADVFCRGQRARRLLGRTHAAKVSGLSVLAGVYLIILPGLVYSNEFLSILKTYINASIYIQHKPSLIINY